MSLSILPYDILNIIIQNLDQHDSLNFMISNNYCTRIPEGTSHGRFMKMMNVKPKNTPTMKSNFIIDDYNYPKGKAAVDSEMPKGKRPYPKNIDWDTK